MIEDERNISFDVKTGMKNIIGRDLITDDYIAIFELVKNSYDAHANTVLITFDDDKITITDDGKGMSEWDLRNKWFAVAYSAKQDGTEDDDFRKKSHLDNLKSKRFYAGAKGVGRFSCDRLGNNLTLTTAKFDENCVHKISVAWKEFEKDAKESFQNIKVPYEKLQTYHIQFPNNSVNGTTLEINSLTSKWDEDRIRSLKFSLEKLINPFSGEDKFEIEIICKKYKDSDIGKSNRNKINGKIKNSILEVLDLKTTQIDIKIIDSKIISKLYDRGTLIYNIEEPNIYSPVITDLKVNLYFLNRSAKIQFGKIMDIEPINYGNVFLFKNGFRVQPYGNLGDDSWGLENRKQQGYNRFLGTRDLFGRVDITTENFSEFKEVSSRDGGLVESLGSKKLMEAFWEKALKRLERYVAGVLWGEAFVKKKYFVNDEEGYRLREQLGKDKDSEDYSIITSNLGSKIDFVNLIKTLSDDKDITIVEYDKNLVSFVNEQLAVAQPKFIKDLEKIAEKTSDSELLQQIRLTEDSFRKLERERDEAEKREAYERKKRIEAEKKAEEEELKRIESEKRHREEEKRRIQAELQTERKEKERYKAELDKLKALQQAKDAEEKRKREEEKNKDLQDKLGLETQKNQYLNATRKTLSNDAEQLVHSIDLYVGNASSFLNDLFDNHPEIELKIKKDLYAVKSNIDKALKVSALIIKSNFDYKHVKQRVNLPLYIVEYLEDIQLSRKDKLKIEAERDLTHFSLISTIDIDIIFDNLISNSLKAGARNISVQFSENTNKELVVDYRDNGSGVHEKFLKYPDTIFELGTRANTEKGSGIGMYDIKKRIEDLKGSIRLPVDSQAPKGAYFQLILK